MVEIEWDGFERAARERRSLLHQLRRLTRVVDPDGRARLSVEIASAGGLYSVAVAGEGELGLVGAEVRDADLAGAVTRAFALALGRWRDAGARPAPRL